MARSAKGQDRRKPPVTTRTTIRTRRSGGRIGQQQSEGAIGAGSGEENEDPVTATGTKSNESNLQNDEDVTVEETDVAAKGDNGARGQQRRHSQQAGQQLPNGDNRA